MNWRKLKNKIKFSSRWLLTAIILASFLIPLTYSFVHRITPKVDARAYDQIATNLIDGFGYREDRNKSYEFDIAIVRAGPAYEFFLAGIYKVFGHYYEVVWIIQALLHALTAWLIFLAARALFKKEQAGLWAAVLFGLHPDLIEVAAMLMTETLFLFLLALILWLFVNIFNKPNGWKSAVLSLVVGLAILTRPTVILFVPVILFFYIVRKNYRDSAIFIVCLTVSLVPWAIRNYFVYHQLIFTNLVGSANLWLGNLLGAQGGQFGGPSNPIDNYINLNGILSFKKQATQEFLFFVLNYPLVFIKLCFLRIIRYFSLIRPMGFWFYQSGIKQLLFVMSSLGWGVVFFISGYSGLVALWRTKQSLERYLIVFALTAPLPLILTVVQSRYRFQIYPFLAVFGGYFINKFLEEKSAVKKYLRVVLIVLLLVSLFDAAYFLPLVIERLHLLTLITKNL